MSSKKCLEDKRRLIEKIDKAIKDYEKMGHNHYWTGFRQGLIKAKRLIENEK